MTKELLQQAHDALITSLAYVDATSAIADVQGALKAIKQALAQQEQPASVDAYVGAREDAAIWKKRALEAEELNRKFIAEVNGPTYLGEPAQQEQPAQEPFGYVQEASWGLHQSEMVQKITRLRQPDYGFVQALYAHHAPTQPALSDAEVTAKGQVAFGSAWNVIGAYYHKGFRDGEAHCRGGLA